MAERRDLFPVLFKAEPVGIQNSARVRSRMRRRVGISRLMARMCGVLNSLAKGNLQAIVEEAGQGARLLTPNPTNVAQGVAIHYLQELVNLSFRRHLFDRAEDGDAPVIGDYAIFAPGRRITLDPELVSLPKDGTTGRAQVLDLLSDELSQMYKDDGIILKKDVQAEDVPRPFLGASREVYSELVSRLEANGLVLLQETPPKVINGVFAVPKPGVKQRLIIDARPANAYLNEPPKTVLPNPGKLGELYAIGTGDIYVCKSDMDNYYYRLALPEWLTQYFGLPKITRDGKPFYPVVRVLPMGWSHSVYLGQHIHERLAEKAGLSQDTSLQVNPHACVDDSVHGEYIDDFFGIGFDKKLLEEMLDKLLIEYDRCAVPAKSEKVERPGQADSVKVLGMWVCKDGKILPDAEKLAVLIARTTKVVKFRLWKPKDIQRLLGHWIWFLMLRRPLLSILAEVYKFARKEEVGKPTLQMRTELMAVVATAPLLYGNIQRKFGELCMATDASSKGGGVVYAPSSELEALELLKGNLAIDKFVPARQWTCAISHKWRKPGRIDILEGEAVILGIKWILRSRHRFHKRYIFLIDNTALMGALKKGRSSVPILNSVCRRVAALTLAGDLKFDYFYVPSALNPADGPSREV